MTEKTKTKAPDTSRTEYLTKKSLREFLGGVGRSTIDTWIKEKNFPKPIKLSQTMPLWRKAEIIDWVESFQEKTA